LRAEALRAEAIANPEGGPVVHSECLPFSAIPHTTALFSDYLYAFPKVQNFFLRPPLNHDWIPDEIAAIRYDQTRRERVTAVLERQNRAWGASPQTLANIDRLRRGACVVVTGQQVGLFGGPLFALLKAVTTVRLANDVTQTGHDCVPLFWLATEDHDLAEVNNALLIGADAKLHPITASTQGVPDSPVGTVQFGDEIQFLVEQAAAVLGDSEAADFLRQSYRPGETFGSGFGKLFARVFREWGVVLLDASDAELHKIAEPVYRAALLDAEDMDQALLERGRALRAGGYHEQVKVTPSSTLLFMLRDGERVPVHRDNGNFRVADERFQAAELMARISSQPDIFSANVLLRPVVQDFLLPTLAYIGGPAEVAYFAQAAVVYEELLGRVTPILPRFSATLIEPRIQRLLKQYGLAVADLLCSPDEFREQLAARSLPPELQTKFEDAQKELERALAGIEASLARLDKTLVEAAQHAASKMQYQLDRLRARAARAELRRTEEVARHADELINSLHPNKNLQEREIAGICYLARHGPDLLHKLYEVAQLACPDHQCVYL
jgi:bacillithiol biosynthesis cysteine-adding enzyme BshC